MDGRLSTRWVVEAHKTEAFALVGGAVDKHLGGDDVSKGQEHLKHLRVGELLGQVVDEDVTALWTFSLLQLLRRLRLLSQQSVLVGEGLAHQAIGRRVGGSWPFKVGALTIL